MQQPDDRPVIVGMNNPYGSDPKYALYPYPENSAGGRLYAMYAESYHRHWGCDLPSKRAGYLRDFDRRNVLATDAWNYGAARLAGALMVPTLAGRRVVLLGRQVARCLSVPRAEWFEQQRVVLDLGATHVAFTAWTVPHPSGLCREYNDPAVRVQAGDLLHQLMQDTPS